MRKREEEELRRQFSVIPEIKQEINQCITIGGTTKHTSKLKEILIELERYPNSTEKDFQKLKVFSIFFERLKASARREILTIRTLLEADLQWVRAGKHTKSDNSGNTLSEFDIDRILTVDVLLSPPAKLIVIYEPTIIRAIFGVCLSIDNVSTSVTQVKISDTWNDPLEAILCGLDLFHSNSDSIGEYNIGYDFHYSIRGSETQIRFHNPASSPLLELEKAFFSVAKIITSQNKHSPESKYLIKWKKYLAKQKNA